MQAQTTQMNVQSLPYMICPETVHTDIVEWVQNNKAQVRDYLNQYGAVLFRGFPIHTVDKFESLVAAATSDQWVKYVESTSPRTEVASNTLTSTEYANDRSIFCHNENSYAGNWPRYIAFWCKKPAKVGGETPLIDCRKIFSDLPDEIKNTFSQKGIMYVRRFSHKMGIPWKKAFRVDSKEEMEIFCQENGIENIEWASDGTPILKYSRAAAIKHPVTGESSWFNHGAFFNINGLEPSLKETFLKSFDQEELPYNTYYGDGSDIEEEVIKTIQEIYYKNEVAIPYQSGDVILVDNMLVAHGRRPFEGVRRVLVAMTEAIKYSSVETLWCRPEKNPEKKNNVTEQV